MNIPELASLRQQIDAIDEELVELLSRRFTVTDRVGHLKSMHGLDAVDEVREAEQVQHLRTLATRYGVNAELVSRIFRTVVEQVVLNHQVIAASANPAND